MATLNAPSPGLYASVLHAMRSADPYETSATDTLSSFAFELTSAEAALFPAALAGVLPLLQGDLGRTRFAVELASRLDLWEIATDVTEVAVSRSDPELILAAAALCGTAGLNGERAARLLGALAATPDLLRAAEIRLRPDVQPRTVDERLLYLQRWPGSRTPEGRSPAAPVVVLDSTLDAAQMLRLAVELLRAGAAVRRVPPTTVPNWFGPETVLVRVRGPHTRILSTYPGFSESRIFVSPRLRNDQEVASLLRRINSALPAASRLRLGDLRTEMALSVWNPEVYGLGVYETREASYLTTAPASTIYRLAKKGLLTPRRYGDFVWAFRDLVAVRTWQYLKSQSAKSISSKLIPSLANFAGDAEAARLGKTSSPGRR
jgi:hypothetical protein